MSPSKIRMKRMKRLRMKYILLLTTMSYNSSAKITTKVGMSKF